MSKKNKKKPQQNLSLKERLQKHWDNRNWGVFIQLFTRDAEVSMRSPWASRWPDALYNCLTAALFVDKDFQSARMALALISGKNVPSLLSSLPSWLHDCASVAGDFLGARESGLVQLSPLQEESVLPSSYAALREGLSSLLPKKAKGKKDPQELIAGKFVTQHRKLEHSKSLSPYTTWLKNAVLLEEAAQGTEHASTFRALKNIIELIREMARPGRGENSLRDPQDIFRHSCFRDIPPRQTHLAVRTLWEFFCRTGEKKYGEDWGDVARVLQLSFMEECPETESLSRQYCHIVKPEELLKKKSKPKRRTIFSLINSFFGNNDDDDDEEEVPLFDMIRKVSTNPLARWTEQERYILTMFYVMHCNASVISNFQQASYFLNAFITLSQLGSKWRPKAPWSSAVRDSFQDVILGSPPEKLPSLEFLKIPLDLISTPAIVRLVLEDDSEKGKKKLQPHLPLRASEEDVRCLAEFFMYEVPSRQTLQTVSGILEPSAYVSLLRRWIDIVLRDADEDLLRNEKSFSQSVWANFSRDQMEEIAGALPPDSPEGCLCALRADAKRLGLSRDTEKIDAFFQALPGNSELGKRFLLTLPAWPEVDPHFLIRLFGHVQQAILRDPNGSFYLHRLIKEVERMTNLESRGVLASGLHDILSGVKARNKKAAFQEALDSLETILEKKKKTASSSKTDRRRRSRLS